MTHNEGRSMEAQPSLAGQTTGQGSGGGVRPLWGHAPEDEQSRQLALDVRGGSIPQEVQRLQRGEVQRMKRGVAEGLARANSVLGLVAKEERFVVLEIYAGTATLTRVAGAQKAKWKALEPVDILYGYDLTKAEDEREYGR